MKKLVAAGFLMVVGVELVALFLPDRRLILVASGGAVALALLAVRWYLVRDIDGEPGEQIRNDAAESLRRWLSRTETTIRWSESTRSDWDRHLRPMLARQFEMATGQKQRRDGAAFAATGRVLFGEELWQWVDPQNVARSGGGEPGPGRSALSEILERLERV
jgi:hypothetical protein